MLAWSSLPFFACGGLSSEALGALALISRLQLQYMMVMVGYPDFLLKPEAVDKEYEVGRISLPSGPRKAHHQT